MMVVLESMTRLCLPRPCPLFRQVLPLARFHRWTVRQSSTDASFVHKSPAAFPDQLEARKAEPANELTRLPAGSILRSIFLGAFLSSNILFKPGLAVLSKIARSQSPFLNPDRNLVIGAIVKPLVYDQFCAGRDQQEICRRIKQIKSLGFFGLVLCYGKEIQIQKSGQPNAEDQRALDQSLEEEVRLWKQGNLETLDMVGQGDWLGIKLSGAGSGSCVTSRMLKGEAAPKKFVEAIDAILQKASDQNCRVWIDSEQQYLQHSIDSWTIDMMRKWNRGGKAVVYNTIQAYLKASRDKIAHQLNLAHQEGWTLAIKLVRGAYIESDIRERIHDSKAGTDHSYDSIVEAILSGTVKGVPEFPKMQLFLAGHNPTSLAKASQLVRDLQAQGRLKTMPGFGQLQGMADQLGCEPLQHFETTAGATGMSSTKPVEVPGVYKCMTWGTIQERIEYLVRRVVENQGATSSVVRDNPVLVRELRRRVIDWLMG